MNYRKTHFFRTAILILLVGFSFVSKGQEINGDAANGEKLFKANCTACHALDKKVIGPALKGVVSRLKKDQNLGRDWFQKWIKNNQEFRASGDKYANEVFNANGKVEMTVFSQFSEKDIDDILTYVENPPAEAPKVDPATATAATPAAPSNDGTAMKLLAIAFLSIAGVLLMILYKINQLVKLKSVKEISQIDEDRANAVSESFEKYKGYSYALIPLFLLISLYGVWSLLMGVGVDKGYKPDQPIYFSHKIHAGDNQINCQYCHTGAKYGKASQIPSLNLCMNCHRQIAEYKGKYIEPGKDREFYTSQIKSLYQHIGWDEASQTYTGKEIPIKWTRIHNMQDFVAFNHATHVVGGEKAIIKSFNEKNPNNKIDVVCKACHGKVDTMNVVQMANDFTMGWCIDCHRTTEIDKSNGYNASYFNKLHEKLKTQKGKDAKLTVEAIGGTECGKCHY